jgi:hypothetical protein
LIVNPDLSEVDNNSAGKKSGNGNKIILVKRINPNSDPEHEQHLFQKLSDAWRKLNNIVFGP